MLSDLFGTPTIIRLFDAFLQIQTDDFIKDDLRKKVEIPYAVNDFLEHAERLGLATTIGKAHNVKIFRLNRNSEIYKELLILVECINKFKSTKNQSSGTGERTQVAVVADLPTDETGSPSIDQSKGSKSGGESGSLPPAPPKEADAGKETSIGEPCYLNGDKRESLSDSPRVEKSPSNLPSPSASELCETCKGSGGIIVDGDDGPDSSVCPDCKGDGIAKSSVALCAHCSLPMADHDGSAFCPPGTEEFGGQR